MVFHYFQLQPQHDLEKLLIFGHLDQFFNGSLKNIDVRVKSLVDSLYQNNSQSSRFKFGLKRARSLLCCVVESTILGPHNVSLWVVSLLTANYGALRPCNKHQHLPFLQTQKNESIMVMISKYLTWAYCFVLKLPMIPTADFVKYQLFSQFKTTSTTKIFSSEYFNGGSMALKVPEHFFAPFSSPGLHWHHGDILWHPNVKFKVQVVMLLGCCKNIF